MTGIVDRLSRIKGPALAIVLLAAWVTASSTTISAQIDGLGTMNRLARWGYEEKKAYFEGPVYGFASRIAASVPRSGSIYLYNPSGIQTSSYIYIRSRYYLYPRRVFDAGKSLNEAEIVKYDYLAAYVTTAQDFRALQAIPFLEKTWSSTDRGSYRALYRVVKGRHG